MNAYTTAYAYYRYDWRFSAVTRLLSRTPHHPR